MEIYRILNHKLIPVSNSYGLGISKRDWRPEVVRILAIFIVVLFHMEFYTQILISEFTNPLILLAGVAIGTFLVISGYVNGLKNEFNKPGLLTKRTYGTFLKKRLTRLYIGYYIALVVVLIAKLLSGHTIDFSTTAPITFYYKNPIPVTPASLVLELTCTWPLTGCSGGIWPEGWFISAMIFLTFAYPLLRRIHSINKNYLFLIIITTVLLRIAVLFFYPNAAYYFPFAWTAEFSCGIILGDYIRRKGSKVANPASYKKVIVSLGARVWPIYLFHMAPIVFMPNSVTSAWDIIFTIINILILAEIFHRILDVVYKKVWTPEKRSVPVPPQIKVT